MNCLVTGATGFTGGHVARELIQRGHSVRALVRDPRKAAGLTAIGVECVPGDLRDPLAVNQAVRGCAWVFHIAALYREAGLPDSVYYDVNVAGTRNVLKAAERDKHVRRFVHCSTVGVHGDIAHPPAGEEAPFNPGDIYQKTKLEAEQVAMQFFQNGVCGTVFRPAGIYGPGDTRFLKLFRTIYKGQFRMFGTGKTLYHLTYIDDLVGGILTLAEHPAAPGRVYILGGARSTTLEELVRSIAEALGVRSPKGHLPLWPLKAAATVCEAVSKRLHIEPLLYPRRVDFFYKDRAFDITRARTEIGYEPKVDLATGLKRTAEWYRTQGLLR
ncbi:MAG: NAD-dependent epimerase/dehydratase family protein [Candidatus Omnitrophica bacterium]|nr:NAD-dependent epimerase/dehydratase family protein [Candidatus Omnitrophota bacterium]